MLVQVGDGCLVIEQVPGSDLGTEFQGKIRGNQMETVLEIIIKV
jgi:hypothetical protein